jgi:hypothetical protein
MKTLLMLQFAIRYPEVYGLAWVQSNSDQPYKPPAKADTNKALWKIIQFVVIAFVGLINPEAANWAVPVLKLCFMLLDYLQKGQNK